MRHAACALFTFIGVIATFYQASADGLTFATWNVADLHHETGMPLRNGSVAREDVDYARLAATAKRIAGDVIALQEVGSPAALERIFPSADYHLIISDRYVPGDEARPPGERDIFTALAISKATFPEPPDVKTVSALSLQHIELTRDGSAEIVRPTRSAMQVEFKHEGRRISFLNVHLKSSCHQFPLRDVEDEGFFDRRPYPSRFDCRTLKAQLAILENWIEAKHALGRRVVVAGDFNRRLNRIYPNPARHEDFWAELNDGAPHGLDLTKGPEGLDTVCWSRHPERYEEHIDLIIADKALLQSFATFGFEKLGLGHDAAPEYAENERKRLSDHCPVVLRLGQ
ncbi:MAG: endonuclease/exonuclease/phosphatase family protein [Boseongicola sp.]|nr:endonuclease/exonuclease/phosphatase family protein [Boseongicola sp.]